MGRNANRLAGETSPYLLQHADNPVDWYPWGTEALEKARRENKPILLSIGYSACHWCHVMARECFEDEQIAELMNRYFVNIKVDREERPDLDQIYQIAAQALSGQGGWPLTVFLTPDERPFYAGTYFPPEDRHGRPGFPRLLQRLHEVFTEQPDRVEAAAAEMVQVLDRVSQPTVRQGTPPPPTAIEDAARAIMASADREWGGFGDQPKFPSVPALEFLLRAWKRSGLNDYRDHVLHTLRKMAAGGIYDQLGGGFHRYSVDRYWLVPHFEKMLYDNASLAGVYLDAYRVSRDPLFKRVVRETLRYVLREMTHPEGGFYSAQDADSDGEEGTFFVWYADEIARLFPGPTADLVRAHFGIDEQGNFGKGATVLHIRMSPRELAAQHHMTVDQVEAILDDARRVMFDVRDSRPRPFRDEKVLAGWNGLMISAFARASQVFAERKYLRAARRAMTFVERRLMKGDRLQRSYMDAPNPVPGFLDDYVFIAQGLIDLYEAQFDPDDLRRAEQVMATALELFWDDGDGGFFFTPSDHEPLIQRFKEGWDESIPSGNGAGAQVLLRLYQFTGESLWREKAEAILALYGGDMVRNPAGFGSMFGALDRYHGPGKEIVIAAPTGLRSEGDHDADGLARRIHGVYLPNRVLARTDGTVDYPPLVAGKTPPSRADGSREGVAVYVCEDFRCKQPVTSWDELEPLLQA